MQYTTNGYTLPPISRKNTGSANKKFEKKVIFTSILSVFISLFKNSSSSK